MYARKYYLLYIEEICYLYIEEICYLNIQEPVSNNIQEPISNNIQEPVSLPLLFLRKVTFDLLTFLPFAAYSSNSPSSPFTSFTFSLSLHSPFPLVFLSLSPPISTSFHSSPPPNIRDKD